MAIRVSDRRRLAALADPRLREERYAVEERVALGDRFSFCLFVAILLDLAEIDPESTCIMREFREAEAALDAIPDTPELEKADDEYLARWDASWIDDLRPRSRYRPPLREEKTVEGEAERLMKRYRAGGEIDVATAPAFDLFAWCLSRHGETYDEAAAECEKAAKDLLLRLDKLPDDPTEEDIERVLSAEENQ